MIVARYALAPLPRLKSDDSDVDHWGRYTKRMPPQTMPISVPVPPSTIAARSRIDNVKGNSPVLTTPVESARSAPRGPRTRR